VEVVSENFPHFMIVCVCARVSSREKSVGKLNAKTLNSHINSNANLRFVVNLKINTKPASKEQVAKFKTLSWQVSRIDKRKKLYPTLHR